MFTILLFIVIVVVLLSIVQQATNVFILFIFKNFEEKEESIFKKIGPNLKGLCGLNMWILLKIIPLKTSEGNYTY